MNFSFECLDEPVTTKISSNKSGKNVAVGTCMMQGWRKSLQVRLEFLHCLSNIEIFFNKFNY